MPRKSLTKEEKNDNETNKKVNIPKENNRFSDVIGKMEEETKKIEAKKKTLKKTDNKKTKKEEIENKYGINRKKESKNEKIQNVSKEKKVENKEDNRLIEIKNNELIKRQEELFAIKKELNSQNKLSNEDMKGTYSKVLKNTIFAVIFVFYFCIIILGYKSLRESSFLMDLKILSILSIIFTIALFEIAYKKDSGKLAVRSIETLGLAISTLLLIYVYTFFENNFILITTLFGLFFMLYFMIKSGIVHSKEIRMIKRKIEKKLDDENEV